MLQDPYALLGVAHGASFQEIRKAYRRRLQETHPDKTKAKTDKEFIAVQRAYREVLAAAPISRMAEQDAYLIVSPDELRNGVYCRCGEKYSCAPVGSISECNSCSNYVYVCSADNSSTTSGSFHSPNEDCCSNNP